MTIEGPCKCCGILKAPLICGVCEGAICKGCAEFSDPMAFSFMASPAAELLHQQYCSFCFVEKIQPAMKAYEDVLKRAKDVYIVAKPPRAPLPISKRSATPLKVEKCDDRDETILRLAFLAAEQGYNAVIKTNVTYQKIRTNGYQKMQWKGTGFAALLDAERFEKYSG